MEYHEYYSDDQMLVIYRKSYWNLIVGWFGVSRVRRSGALSSLATLLHSRPLKNNKQNFEREWKREEVFLKENKFVCVVKIDVRCDLKPALKY